MLCYLTLAKMSYYRKQEMLIFDTLADKMANRLYNGLDNRLK